VVKEVIDMASKIHGWDKKRSNAASILGQIGGKSKSHAKIVAARRNGKLGGWPKGRKRKVQIPA
jgi:hypothetical protein